MRHYAGFWQIQSHIITNARQHTFTNLTPMTRYTFSVVATNSIGSGEAGVVMITTPGEYNYTNLRYLCMWLALQNPLCWFANLTCFRK